jgi:hypothetical protein
LLLCQKWGMYVNKTLKMLQCPGDVDSYADYSHCSCFYVTGTMQHFNHFDIYMSKAGVYLCDLVSSTVPWHHAGGIDRYWYEYRVSRDAFRYPSYALHKHVWERGLLGGGGGEGEQKKKALELFFTTDTRSFIHVTCIAAMHIIFMRIGCTLFTCDM